MQFNQYSLYSLNFQNNISNHMDEVDVCIQEVRDMTLYEDIKSYLTEHFGNFSGEKWVEYPELHKDLFLRLDKDKIEVCALKNDNQYFGRGWKLIDDK